MFYRGIVVVLTGKSPNYSRAHLTKRIKDAGGTVANAVTGNVNLVVAANHFTATGKYSEAVRRQIPIALYDDFLDAIQRFQQLEQTSAAPPPVNAEFAMLVNLEAANALIATLDESRIIRSRYRDTF